MKPFARVFAAAGALALLPVVTHAHFKLVEPASWLIGTFGLGFERRT